MKKYITDYFNILQNYYNCNKLQINPDKTQMTIVCKPKFRQQLKIFLL